MIDLKQKVLSGLRWSMGARLAGQAATWSITLIVMRLLTPTDYGLVALSGFFINFLALLNELGLGASVIQKANVDDASLRQIFGLVLLINVGLFLALLCGAPLIAMFFREERIVPILRVSSIQFLAIGLAIIPQSMIDRQMSFRDKSIVDLVSTIVGAFTTLALALMGFEVWSLVFGSLAVAVSRTIGLNVIFPYVRRPIFSFKGLGQNISFGTYVTLSRTVWFLFNQADILVVGKVLGRELLGFYSVGNNLASMPMEKVSGIINQVAFPAFSRIQAERRRAASHFLKAVRMMSFCAFPVLWGISSVAPECVAILLGDKWRAAAIPFQLLALVIPIRMVSNLIAPAAMGLGRPDIPLTNSIFALMVLPVSILIGSHWGLVGVSAAWVIAFPLVFVRYVFRAVPLFGIRVVDVLSAMSRPVMVASIMYLAVVSVKLLFKIDGNSINHLVLLILIGVGVYGLVITRINREGYREVLALILGR